MVFSFWLIQLLQVVPCIAARKHCPEQQKAAAEERLAELHEQVAMHAAAFAARGTADWCCITIGSRH